MIYLKKLQAFSSAQPPLEINNFSSNGTTLLWDVTGADTVEINQGIGAVATSGSLDTGNPLWPYGGTRTYTLTATADGQNSYAQVTITYAACIWAVWGHPHLC